ncbi:recombinase family protein, partial [Noviherbaspirillum sp. CPCC 100848]
MMKPIQAALYARVSSNQQANAQTIDSQLSALRERMQIDACTSTPDREFVDDGWSGANLMRPALERLRDAVSLGAVDRLYVHSPDRLARKYAYQVLLIDELQRAGVEVIFLNHSFGRTPEEEMLLQVQGMIAEYERAKILERSRRGKRHKAQTGQVSVLSAAPYGYRYVSVHDGAGCARYEIVEEHAQVVRKIFVWVVHERMTIGEICRRLEHQQILTPRGKSWWDRSVVWRILKNPAYAGQAAFGKTKFGPFHSRLRPQRHQRLPISRTVITVPPEQWQSIPVPALVDHDLFAAVQEQLQENRALNRTRKRGARHLLQGLVVCKQCGYAYYCKPVSVKDHVRQYAYYRCIGSDAYRFAGQRRCNNGQVRADYLEKAVWSEVKSLLLDPHRLTQEYERRLQTLEQPTEDTQQRHLEVQLRQCRQGITRVIDAYAEGYLEKHEFEGRLTRLRDRQKTLEGQIAQLTEQAISRNELQLIVGRLEDFAAKVTAGIDSMGFEAQRELIRMLVKRIEIDQENVNIVFRITSPGTDGLGTIENMHNCWRGEHVGLGKRR